jgi:hypothetical protein
VPAGVTGIVAELRGAGGGGGAFPTDYGGGQGGFVRAYIPVTPGDVLAVQAGRGGSGASSQWPSEGGTASQVSRGGTTLATAPGGTGGSGQAAGPGGATGTVGGGAFGLSAAAGASGTQGSGGNGGVRHPEAGGGPQSTNDADLSSSFLGSGGGVNGPQFGYNGAGGYVELQVAR